MKIPLIKLKNKNKTILKREKKIEGVNLKKKIY
jgi:hypothetical protein